MTDQDDRLRIDKWLWAARFYKTRGLATEAVSGGKVHVNGARVKAAYKVRPGDEVRLKRGACEFVVAVTALSGRRGPATEAQKLYTETPQSIEAREREAEQRKIMRLASAPVSSRRPNKKERRHIVRFIRKQD